MMSPFYTLWFCFIIIANTAYLEVSKDMRSFTSALKAAHITANEELKVYENTDGPGVVTGKVKIEITTYID